MYYTNPWINKVMLKEQQCIIATSPLCFFNQVSLLHVRETEKHFCRKVGHKSYVQVYIRILDTK